MLHCAPMMHCTLFVPDLLPAALREWPEPRPHAPRLAALLARGDATTTSTGDTEAWLCAEFGVARQNDWPVAPLTLTIDGGEPADHYWLRCDPVHLLMRQHRMVLSPAAGLPTADESEALIASLNAHFGGDGLLFVAGGAGRWYVRSEAHHNLTTHTLSQALNRDIDALMPAGADSRFWRRLFNEAQMLLHTHPVNAARESRGQHAFNSLWLWGGGTIAGSATTRHTQLWADDALARALAARANIPCAALPENGGELFTAGGNMLAVITALRDNTPDLPAWCAAVEQFEQQWLLPCHAALQKGRLHGLTLVTTGTEHGKQFDLTRRHLWRWWRRARPLDDHG